MKPHSQIRSVLFFVCSLLFPLLGVPQASFSQALSPVANEQVSTEPSAFEKSLMMHYQISTSEKIVEMGGRKFRRVEFQNETFYLALQADLSSAADLLVLCGEKQAAAFNRGSAAHITLSAKITKRSRLFIEGLRMVCSGPPNQAKLDLIPDIAIGFQLDDSDPKAVFKNKKITINPFSQILGFSAEW